MLTIGTRADGRHPLDDAVIEHPRGEHAVVAGHHPGDVLDRLANVEPDLLATRVHGVTAELDDGHLHRLARAVRRLLEDQRDTRAGEHGRQVGPLGQMEHVDELVGARSVMSRRCLMPEPPRSSPRPRRVLPR